MAYRALEELSVPNLDLHAPSPYGCTVRPATESIRALTISFYTLRQAKSMASRNLLLLPGDGIGPEAMAEVRHIIGFMNESESAGFEIEEGLVGGSAYDAHGKSISEEDMAKALSAAQTKELKAALKSVVGKEVAINATIDPSILGGMIVKVGSRQIDTSLKTRLSSLKLALKEVG